jgi:hypothetical protein
MKGGEEGKCFEVRSNGVIVLRQRLVLKDDVGAIFGERVGQCVVNARKLLMAMTFAAGVSREGRLFSA